jgi:hypothetical protein
MFQSRTLCMALLVALLVPLLAHAQQRQLTSEQWAEDLHGVVACMRELHPDLHYRISAEGFAGEVDAALRRIEEADSDEACAVALMRVVACIEDGHTKWLPEGRFALDRWYPLRMHRFPDGIFLTAIDEEHAAHVASRVLRIGRLAAAEAWSRIESIVPGDNDFMRQNRAAIFASSSKVLFGLGISDSADVLVLELETPEGGSETLTLHSFQADYDTTWFKTQGVGPGDRDYVHAFSGDPASAPLHLRNACESYEDYWFEHLVDERALYMQMNRVYESEDESFEDFRRRMWGYYDANEDRIDRFIIDLRYNNGGMGLMLPPFLGDIIKRDRINERGRLFVLVGRGTYSAAVFLMAMMHVHTEVTFVGEPPACAFNMFSDALTFGFEPNHSGGWMRIATVHFHLDWPDKKDLVFAPHYPAPFASRDYFEGRDPALEAALSGRPRIVEAVLEEDGPLAALDYYLSIDTQDWGVNAWHTPGHAAYRESLLDQRAYELRGSAQLEEAIAVYELSTLLFPESITVWNNLGDAYMVDRVLDMASVCYERCLELDPGNTRAREQLEEIASHR